MLATVEWENRVRQKHTGFTIFDYVSVQRNDQFIFLLNLAVEDFGPLLRILKIPDSMLGPETGSFSIFLCRPRLMAG